MNISEKIKAINNKLKTKLNTIQTEKLLSLSSGNVSKYEFFNAFYQKDLLGKAATIKRFEYSPLSKELKKQTIVAEKWYQSFDKVFMHNEKEKPVKTSVNTSVKQQIQF